MKKKRATWHEGLRPISHTAWEIDRSPPEPDSNQKSQQDIDRRALERAENEGMTRAHAIKGVPEPGDNPRGRQRSPRNVTSDVQKRGQ